METRICLQHGDHSYWEWDRCNWSAKRDKIKIQAISAENSFCDKSHSKKQPQKQLGLILKFKIHQEYRNQHGMIQYCQCDGKDNNGDKIMEHIVFLVFWPIGLHQKCLKAVICWIEQYTVRCF
jgi:hypothetical protein